MQPLALKSGLNLLLQQHNLAKAKIFIDDTAMLDIMGLRAKARKLKS